MTKNRKVLMGSVKRAASHCLAARYHDAIEEYSKISEVLGRNLFSANIAYCERRLRKQDTPRLGVPSADIEVVFISDDAYLMPTYVAISTIIKARDISRRLNITLFAVGIEPKLLAILIKIRVAGVEIKVVPIGVIDSSFQIKKKGFHVSTAATLKFRLPSLLPHLRKALYLDGDTVINHHLRSIFDVPIDDVYAAVVADVKTTLRYRPTMLEKLGITAHRNYFNSGVMLLNLEKMRADGLEDRLFEYRRTGVNYFMDQDALNVVFADKVKYLSCNYNFMVPLLESFTAKELSEAYAEDVSLSPRENLSKRATIVHYASKTKPWLFSSDAKNLRWLEAYLTSGASQEFTNFLTQDRRLHLVNNLVVSLTSYPARIESVATVIKSLLRQRLSPKVLVLWLASEQFPKREHDLPSELLKLTGQGLEIRWCEDLKSYKKLIPSLSRWPDSIIVTADDDIVYGESWLLELAASYLQFPEAIHCCRAHQVQLEPTGVFKKYREFRRNVSGDTPSFERLFTGCGGVLYPPGSLHRGVLDIDCVKRHFSAVDDLWFWVMAVRNGTRVRVVPDNSFRLEFVAGSQESALWRTNDSAGGNDVALQRLAVLFPDLIKRLSVGAER